MKKNNPKNNRKKVLIVILGITLAVLLITAAFLSRPKTAKVGAQTAYPSADIFCNEPIPTGKTWHDVLGIMHDVYDQLQGIKGSLDLGAKELETAVVALNENPNICDFRACSPQVINQGPDISLKVSYIVGTKTVLSGRIPLCKPKQCIGQPCPDIDKYLKTLKEVRDSVKSSRQTIHDMFTKETAAVGEDLKKENENPWDKITLPEKAERELQLAREWFHPAAGYRKSCALNETEKIKAEEGEIGDVYPARCVDALEMGIYWPKPWSKACQSECQKGPNKECRECLGGERSCKEDSVLAKINCHIYGACQDKCQGELSKECLQCLCRDESGKELSEEECIAWVCGGNYYNYVCCHSKPLKQSK